jgi:hypothetical protein
MKIVKVFKTDVRDQTTAKQIAKQLESYFEESRINFDLDDCDNILRIESRHSVIGDLEIQELVTKWGYQCEPVH